MFSMDMKIAGFDDDLNEAMKNEIKREKRPQKVEKSRPEEVVHISYLTSRFPGLLPPI